MSELSVRQYLHNDGSGLTLGYDKSEADKVIAEKDKKIDLYHRGWEESDRINASIYAELRHQKRERCLLRSVIAEMNATHFKELFYDAGSEALADEYNKQITIHYKWRKLWMELAEKFKTNPTAQ